MFTIAKSGAIPSLKIRPIKRPVAFPMATPAMDPAAVPMNVPKKGTGMKLPAIAPAVPPTAAPVLVDSLLAHSFLKVTLLILSNCFLRLNLYMPRIHNGASIAKLAPIANVAPIVRETVRSVVIYPVVVMASAAVSAPSAMAVRAAALTIAVPVADPAT